MVRLPQRAMILVLVLLIICSATIHADGNTFIGVAVNDTLISFPDALPEVRDDVTYVPIRSLAASLRASVVWDAATDRVIVSKFHKEIILDPANNRVLVGAGKSYPCSMFLKNGRVMVPYRQIGNLLGYGISYIAEGPLVRAFFDLETALSDQQLLQKVAADLTKQKEEAYKREPPPPPKPKSDKVAYLTFDDGPSKYTARILDVLAQYKVQGTFFMLEGAIWNNPDVVKRMVKEGHGVGLHGSTHRAASFYASPEAAIAEMKSCNDALNSVAGIKTSLIRVPFGSKPSFTEKYRDVSVRAGYHLWDWNVDTGDSRSASVPIDSIIQAARDQIPKQKRAVILMHDRVTSVEALPAIIEFLQKNNYELGGPQR